MFMTHTQRQGKRRSRWYGGSRRGWPLVKYGMIWFGIGVVITIATYAFAVGRGGGIYLVSYGPMAFGAYCMVRGGIDVARERRAARPAADRSATGQAAGWDAADPAAAGWDADPAAAGWDRGPTFTPAPDYQARAGAMPDGGMPAGRMPTDGMRQGTTPEMRQGAMSMAAAAPPQPDWYPDPRNPAMLRWWDGQIWTNHTRPYN
jgi:uncharacterized protein DUF2510